MTLMQFFSGRELQLLGAAVNPDAAAAVASWERWSSQITLEDAQYPERRLLSAVYGHLSLIAPGVDLPKKMRGKARATLASNHVIARATVQLCESLGAASPILLSEAIAICMRFDAWATRDVRAADIHVPAAALKDVGAALSATGWHFQASELLPAPTAPEAAAFGSLSAMKGRLGVRIHWSRSLEGKDGPLTQGMWADAEDVAYLGRTVSIQSAEDSLVAILRDRLRSDDRSEALLAVVDAAWLLPVCRPSRLSSHLATASLSGAFHELATLLQELGAPKEAVSRVSTSSSGPTFDGAMASDANITGRHIPRRRTAAIDVRTAPC
jgi:hypothetical protein